MSIPTEISIEDWNNYIEQSYNIIVNITKEQSTDMLSQFIDDIINNNFDNINQIQFKNDISQIIEKLSLFGSLLSNQYHRIYQVYQ
jgi:hypothetical protein